MEDPDLIAILIPVGDLTKHVFSHKFNENRYLPPTEGFNDEPLISSREATPAYAMPQEDDSPGDEYEKSYRLLLDFDKPPKNPSKGYAFGTDQQKCDVLLGSRGARGISGVHFHILFDVVNKKTRFVLRDSSTNGTAVSYDGQAREEVRHQFTWILDLEKHEVKHRKSKKWEIEVLVRGLIFKIKLASHRTCEAEYQGEVEKFLKISRIANPSLGDLSIVSHTTEVAPSQSRTPRQRPVYISEGSLGKGSFGQVDRVIDVSTGAIYARKTFFEPSWERDEKRKKTQVEKWLDKIRREIRIMREHPHKHIISILDFQDHPQPFLVMEYLPLGSLHHQHHKIPLIESEVVDLLFQGLTVLEHLHSRGVTYRDLKPENILVEDRSPLRVQFADFGLANDQPHPKTFCGSEQYSAPEVFIGGEYTTAVDIWSLGVIVLEYVYKLPMQHRQTRTSGEAAMRGRGLAWCRHLVEHAKDWDSDPLIDLLIDGMLRMKAQERLSADACLTKGFELRLFDESSAGSRGTTPTRTRAPARRAQTEEETPTIIVGSLSDAGSALCNYGDDEDQAGRSTFEPSSATSTSSQLEVSGSQNNGDVPRPRKETPEAVFGRLRGRVQSSTGPPPSLETRSMFFGYKRPLSPAVSPPSNQSNGSRVKRRPPNYRLSKVGASGVSKVPSASNHAGEVVKANVGYVQMTIGDQVVFMQEDNCLINATQILKLSSLTQEQRKRRLTILRNANKVQELPAKGNYGHMNGWINICEGKELCDKLGLEQKLQPLLDHGLSLYEMNSNDTGNKGILPPHDDSLEISVDRLSFAKGCEQSQSPYIELIYNTRLFVIRRSDWKINCVHIANQMAGKSMMPKLLQDLPSVAREIVRASPKYTGTYVDFDYGIKLCNTYKLFSLANQLATLRRTETERAAAPVLEDPGDDESYEVPIPPRSADSYTNPSPTVDGLSNPEKSLMLEDFTIADGTRKPKSERSEDDDDSDESSVNTDITHFHASRSDESDNEMSSQQSNDDTERYHNQRVEGKISYYSYGDFGPRKSELQEAKLDLQAPSKTSSLYGSMTDVSHSFLLTVSDE